MMYTRAQRSDFDSWNAKGWSADEMLPLMKKVSHAEGTCVLAFGQYLQASDTTFL